MTQKNEDMKAIDQGQLPKLNLPEQNKKNSNENGRVRTDKFTLNNPASYEPSEKHDDEK